VGVATTGRAGTIDDLLDAAHRALGVANTQTRDARWPPTPLVGQLSQWGNRSVAGEAIRGAGPARVTAGNYR
jgi:hypothetical protein